MITTKAHLQYALRDVVPYRGRQLDHKRAVLVRACRERYSVLQDNRVVARADALMLADAVFLPSGDVLGTLTWSGMGTDAREASLLARIAYSARRRIFCHDLTSLPIEKRAVDSAWIVAMNQRGIFGAYF